LADAAGNHPNERVHVLSIVQSAHAVTTSVKDKAPQMSASKKERFSSTWRR
jgi:hypothetical protein